MLDIEAVAAVAHEAGVPLVVDNTIATPYLIRPLEWGADVVVHSATKYLGGHGTSIAGVIVDGGTFDFAADPEKFPNYNTPEESYHGLVFARDLGVGSPLGANLAFILKARVQLLRDLGPAIAPFNAFLIAQGIETLSLRIERHLENTHKVAAFLQGRDQVERSCGRRCRTTSPTTRRRSTRRAAPARCSPSRSPGGVEAGRRFVEALTLHSHVANIGDVRSLAIHPASTTHSQGPGQRPARRRGHPRAGAPRRRHRAHRRHPRRPRAGLHRRQGRLTPPGPACPCACSNLCWQRLLHAGREQPGSTAATSAEWTRRGQRSRTTDPWPVGLPWASIGAMVPAYRWSSPYSTDTTPGSETTAWGCPCRTFDTRPAKSSAT